MNVCVCIANDARVLAYGDGTNVYMGPLVVGRGGARVLTEIDICNQTLEWLPSHARMSHPYLSTLHCILYCSIRHTHSRPSSSSPSPFPFSSLYRYLYPDTMKAAVFLALLYLINCFVSAQAFPLSALSRQSVPVSAHVPTIEVYISEQTAYYVKCSFKGPDIRVEVSTRCKCRIDTSDCVISCPTQPVEKRKQCAAKCINAHCLKDRFCTP